VRATALWRAAAAFCAAGLICAEGGAQDYPQWRGVHRDGRASAFRGPRAWPGTLIRRWKVEVGEGYGTPLVIKNTVYVFTRRGGDEVLSAIDAQRGDVKWQSRYPLAYTPGQPASAHGAWPKATPVFADVPDGVCPLFFPILVPDKHAAAVALRFL